MSSLGSLVILLNNSMIMQVSSAVTRSPSDDRERVVVKRDCVFKTIGSKDSEKALVVFLLHRGNAAYSCADADDKYRNSRHCDTFEIAAQAGYATEQQCR